MGRALEAALAIVFMAVLLDRLSDALARMDLTHTAPATGFRLLPENWAKFTWARGVEQAIDKVYRGCGRVSATLYALLRRQPEATTRSASSAYW